MRSFTPGFVVTAIAVLLLATAAMFAMSGPGLPEGEVWRRGLLGGDQLRLLPGNRYRIERWSCVFADETVESGTWTRLGDTVSLVPSTPGRSAYLMRETAEDGERLLRSVPPEGDPWERLD